jgi:hypothetical protein
MATREKNFWGMLEAVETPPAGAPLSNENHDATTQDMTPHDATTDKEIGDLPDHSLSEANQTIDDIYGNHVPTIIRISICTEASPIIPFDNITGGVWYSTN